MTDSQDPPVASAGSRFPCANCHAAQTFDPVRGMLHCAYCGTVREVPPGPPPAHPGERALADGLRAAGPPAAWLASAPALRCRGCGATVVVGAETIAATCLFCGTASVLPAAETGRRLLPDSVLPFCVEKPAAALAFARWIKGLWLRPTALRHLLELQPLHGVYVPFWIFNARVDSEWTAESGRYYYVDADEYTILGDALGPAGAGADAESSDESPDEPGGGGAAGVLGGARLPAARRRRVRKTRWRTARGQRSDVQRDVLVCASQGLQGALADRLSRYELRRLVPYADGYLAGFAAEAYAVELAEGHARARRRMDAAQQELCAAAVPGDTQRNLVVRNRYSEETFRYALLPLWIATYRYRGQLYRFVVSGQTGEVVGQAPYSYLKVGLSCAVGLTVFLLCWYLWHQHPELGRG